MISKLEIIETKSFIEEINTDGHTPIKVIGSDYQVYIVKNSRAKKPSFSLLSEILCHFLLSIWEIPAPDIKLIKVDKLILPDNLSPVNKSIYFDSLCFASRFIPDSIDTNELTVVANKVDQRRINNPYDIFNIALFDIWVENDDRKRTNNNLLLCPNNETLILTAIDHAFVFSYLAYTDLDPQYVSVSYNDSILLSTFAHGIIENTEIDADFINNIRKRFYLCVENCKNSYHDIVKSIPEEMGFSNPLQESISNFLFNEERNEKVFTEFLARLDR